MTNVNWQVNRHKNHHFFSSFINLEEIKKAIRFHQTLPGYFPTPLFSLQALANYLKLADILVKDESYRFNLNSFKVLGSSYAIANYLSEGGELKFSNLKEKIKNKPIHSFATATDGNHGLGLAWMARQLGQQAVVYMPKGSSDYRLAKIREEGAQAEITLCHYDDTVRYVSQLSQKHGWILMQDTSWDGYFEIPIQIMQGYLTIVAECIKQFNTMKKELPTHVILQAGVGSFAAAIANGLKQLVDTSHTFIIVEPIQADCLFQSGSSPSGAPQNAHGDLSTIMAGLSCGEPNPIAWNILKNVVDCFVTCPDYIAAKGMRIFGNPLNKDSRIISGESGAVTLGLLVEICKNPLLKELKEFLKLDSTSRILLINTEGDTDPESYRAICWDGLYSPQRRTSKEFGSCNERDFCIY